MLVTRNTGASRSSKPFSMAMAMISLEMLHTGQPSSTTTMRLVFFSALLRSFSQAVAMDAYWLGETALSITIWPLNLRVETPKGAKGLAKGSSLEAT